MHSTHSARVPPPLSVAMAPTCCLLLEAGCDAVGCVLCLAGWRNDGLILAEGRLGHSEEHRLFSEGSGVEMTAQDKSKTRGAGLKVASHLKASKRNQRKENVVLQKPKYIQLGHAISMRNGGS